MSCIVKITSNIQRHPELTSKMTADQSMEHELAQRNNLSEEMEKCTETLSILDQGVKTLMSDNVRIASKFQRNEYSIQSPPSDHQQLKLSIDEKESFLAKIAPDRQIIQENLTKTKEDILTIEYTSYDGTLIWRITNVSDKMADAQSERQTSIYSPPFYSSSTGYKMRARLYLHGDGNARRTHMSLFFVLMKGKYDAVLKFPFNYKVTFVLYDQSGQNRHVIDSFRPDTKSNSFQRPQSDMNIASGIPKFFPLRMIQQDDNNYVKDDTMFIKILVDFGDVPKMMLPFVISLNPGLPLHDQQHLIKQELEKRTQAAAS
ncbi:unnamed protein product [Didymodactylos carnosus]|uniref:MATH domain-containing protein n=1 Tax=Didymodactylos carnosus TaxID=1234261 RepID=A0A8S2DZ21_9BILA|nr:unnamed protein product [Didymodactylos carnosus]CAF3789571.1 unnamed protein product [Didymodactylos carnosus]